MSRKQFPSRMEASAEQCRVLIYGRRPECTQRLGPVCTGDAGYITAPEPCAEQSVTPAAPADISMFEIYGFDHENLPEETDDYQR